MRICKLLISLSFLLGFSTTFAKSDIEFCYNYANTSVEQNKKNIQLHCGLKGLRWSDDLLGQMQWCMTVRRGIPTAENQARQQLLNSCKSNQRSSQTHSENTTDNSSFCDSYAQTAVEQNQQNLKQQCGYTGLRWSNDKEGQAKWCLTVNNKIASKENQARKQLLDTCLAKQAPSSTAASRAILVQSVAKPQSQTYKSAKVQQLFPQKAIETDINKMGFNDLGSFLLRYQAPIVDSALSRSGKWLAQGSHGSNDSTLKIWDLQKGKLLYVLAEEARKEGYSRLSFSPDEKYLIAGDSNITDIWDWKNARLLHRIGYFLPLNMEQSFDNNHNLYLLGDDQQTVARFNLASGKNEASWKLAKQSESIRGFAVSKNGKIAITKSKAKRVILKVFDSQTNKLLYENDIPPLSIYTNKGSYPSGLLLGFIDDENLAFYNLKAMDDQAFISRLNLPTKTIETIRLADDTALKTSDFINTKKISARLKEKLCPGGLPKLAWKNPDQLHCQLKHQDVQNNTIFSSYLLNDDNKYYRMTELHDIKGNIIAYFGAKSNARWFWLNAQNGVLKNSDGQWSVLPNPNRKPNIYHFDKHIVPLETNTKTTKTYRLPKADIKRLEVLLGSNDTVDYQPKIEPSFGDYTLSHNGRWLVAGSPSGEGVSSYALWDLERNVYVKSFNTKIAWSHRSSVFSPDDNYLVLYYGSTRGHYAPCMECSSVIDIWNIKKSKYEFSIPLLDRNNKTTPPVLLKNGDMYLNASNRVVQKWNIKQQRFIEIFRPAKKDQDVFSIIGNGGDLLAISVKQKRPIKYDLKRANQSWIEVWSISKHRIIKKIPIVNKELHYGVEFNSVFVNETQIAVSTTLHDLIIWDAISGKHIKTLVPKTEFGDTYKLSSEGNGILISAGQYIQRWDVSTGELLMTVNACQPDMPGLPVTRYTELKRYTGIGSAKVAAGKVISAFSCPQGGRSKIWNMKTGELKALFGINYKSEWFWLNDKEELKSTAPPPP